MTLGCPEAFQYLFEDKAYELSLLAAACLKR